MAKKSGNENSSVSDYQILSEIEHVRARPGMYIGSITPETSQQWVYDSSSKKMMKQELATVPGLIKIFSEILDNAIDESKRTTLLNTIKVDFHEDGSITIMDNGRGFPCEIHPTTGKHVVETVFTNLRAGSNFNDAVDQATSGTHGLGQKLTVILSTAFSVETADGTKLYKQSFDDGMKLIGTPKITDSDKHYTKITFKPDYTYFGYENLDDDHILRMTKRIVDAAACNPRVKFAVNGERINTKNFDDYIKMYLDEGEESVFDDTPTWKVGVSKSNDGFDQVSFVNSVETYQGGEHVKYAINQIVDELRVWIKKKHKVEVSPADIRNHLRIYISCDINRPRFSSQTKENMISLASEWKTSWTVPEKFILKLVKTDIIQSILDWAQAKANAVLAADLRKAGKEQSKADPRKIEKFSDAIERKERHKCVIFLSEGDTLDENEMVLIQRDGEIVNVPLREVVPGDLVLTHMNRFKPVVSTSPKVIEGVKIKFDGGELTISPEHRMIAYNVTTGEFGEVKGKDINPLVHKLIKNTLTDANHASFSKLSITDPVYQYEVIIDGVEPIKSTAVHQFLVYNMTRMEYEMVACVDLNIFNHRILTK